MIKKEATNTFITSELSDTIQAQKKTIQKNSNVNLSSK